MEVKAKGCLDLPDQGAAQMEHTHLVLYAFDGSGVGLRARCTFLDRTDGYVRIRLTGDNPSAAATLANDAELRGIPTDDDTFWVPEAALYEPGTYAPLASFNFLD